MQHPRLHWSAGSLLALLAVVGSCSDDRLPLKPQVTVQPDQPCPACDAGPPPILDVPYALSSGGDTLVYGHTGTDSLAEGIYLKDIAAGTPPQYLMPFTSADRADPDPYSLRFTADGARLAFVSARGGGRDLWVMDVSSRQVRQVTFTYGNCEYGDWDPSGRFLVYTKPFLPAGAPDTAAGLFLIDTETLEGRALAHGGHATYGGEPRWSPDSSKVTFWYGVQLTIGSRKSAGLHVFTAGLDGSEPIDLTPTTTDNCQSPVWIEGGRHILYERFSSSTFSIHSTWEVAGNGGATGPWPLDLYLPRSRLSGDGRYFAYTGPDSSGVRAVIYRQSIDDAKGVSRRQITLPH